MLLKNTTLTIISKFIILLANFLIVVFTTQIWGSNGRGEIALIIADIAIISILSNITCGSTVTFHTPKLNRNMLLGISLIGAIIFSITGSVVFSLIFGFRYFQILFVISLLISLNSSISSYWLGKNNIKWYNLLTLISPIFVLLYLLLLFFIFRISTINACFYAYYLGLGTVLILGIAGLIHNEPFEWPDFDLNGLKKIVAYGFKNELSYFIQFLNYRLSYFFVAQWLGLSSLGVFSVVVSVTEAVWIISKSMSAIHYSKVINTIKKLDSIRATMVFARQSFWITILCLGLLLLMPKSLFEFIFGSEFGTVKIFTLYLLPGIIAIAVSNIYGHYFAGVGQLNILRNKSLIGFVVTVILVPLLITKYQLVGVCITLNVSYVLSSIYLYYKYILEKKLRQQENTF
jgi:O-antigen/teichoic acid export membrane protein